MVPRHQFLSYTLGVLLVALSACAPAPETTPEAVDRPADAAPVPETADDSPDESAVEVSREWWKDLGVVLDPEELGVRQLIPEEGFGVSDIKVAELPDGSYVAVVASHAIGGPASFHVVESSDLVAWTEVARFDMEQMLGAGFYIGTLIALPDGAITMIGVSDRPGQAIVSSTSRDGGRTWAADPGPLLTVSDFEGDLRLVSASVVARPDGGWRMYVSADDCEAVNLHGQENCSPDGREPMGAEAETILSAVSDDLATWTPEPGVRFRGSQDNGSMGHLHAWIDDDGRVRLTGHMKWNPAWVWPDDAPEPEDGHLLSALSTSDGAVMELVSDDGLDFPLDSYRAYRLNLSDIQVLRGPGGSFFMLGGAQGDRLEDQRGQIRLLELTTISWELEPAVPMPISWQVPAAERLEEDPFLTCYRIDVRGTGTIRFDSRASGWPFIPGSAPEENFEIINPVVEAPGSAFFKRSDHHDVDDRLWAGTVVAVDEDGVTWMVQPFAFAQYGFPGEVHGHDLDSLPCPP